MMDDGAGPPGRGRGVARVAWGGGASLLAVAGRAEGRSRADVRGRAGWAGRAACWGAADRGLPSERHSGPLLDGQGVVGGPRARGRGAEPGPGVRLRGPRRLRTGGC